MPIAFKRQPIERLEKKVDRENLWLCILCLLEEKERYGFEIRELIQKRFGFLAGNVTAYKVLHLLKRGGYVEQYLKDGKKYYRITKRGKEQLKKANVFFKKKLKSFGWL